VNKLPEANAALVSEYCLNGRGEDER